MNITAPWMIKEESIYKYCSNQNPKNKAINFFNNQNDSFSTISEKNEMVGGRNQKCNILVQIGQQSIDFLKPNGFTMEEYLDVILKKVNRIDFL
ncbi:MAG: hypothetical protein ACQXXF_01975 [Thermoplasmatota archaeon]|jgi:hypothetical protein